MLCTAHALADLGEVDIKAIVHDTGYASGVGAISVINAYYGRDYIPIGAYRGPVGRPRASTAFPAWTNQGRGAYVPELLNAFRSSRVRDAWQVRRNSRSSSDSSDSGNSGINSSSRSVPPADVPGRSVYNPTTFSDRL